MSRTPEGRVKDYLKARVTTLGGEIRFCKWVGRRNAPDIRVMFPTAASWPLVVHGENGATFTRRLENCWVETKAKGAGGKLSSGQSREILRMREHGERVLVLFTTEDIDKEFPI